MSLTESRPHANRWKGLGRAAKTIVANAAAHLSRSVHIPPIDLLAAGRHRQFIRSSAVAGLIHLCRGIRRGPFRNHSGPIRMGAYRTTMLKGMSNPCDPNTAGRSGAREPENRGAMTSTWSAPIGEQHLFRTLGAAMFRPAPKVSCHRAQHLNLDRLLICPKVQLFVAFTTTCHRTPRMSTLLHRNSVTSECPWKGLLRKVGVTGTDPPPLTELAGKRNRSTRRYAADVLGWLTATVSSGRTKRSGGDSCMGVMESMEFHLLVGHPICTPGTILEGCGLHGRHPEGLRMECWLHVCGS